jgi:hydroxymethylglutaryl-CoA reductase (NADPH)
VRVSTDGVTREAAALSGAAPLHLRDRETLQVAAARDTLAAGRHRIGLALESPALGPLHLEVVDSIEAPGPEGVRIPREAGDDYSACAVRNRQRFVHEVTGATLAHVSSHSFDPHLAAGNCEHFTGVAQVPIGFAGPLHVEGEHAVGDFLIPLATSEGTLVASYNRGIGVLNRSGGVKCTVVGEAIQRAPVFEFDDARAGRDFASWVQDNLAEVRTQAEATDPFCRLVSVESYLASRFTYLRFNYTTGDAGGQNTASRATLAACGWILERQPQIRNFYLEANLATDKKPSHINTLHTRGKRVTAEAVIPRDVLMQRLRVEPEQLVHHYGVANLGALLSGTNNNGLHSANAITAMFIATGQDVADVSEASAALLYADLTPTGDLYMSVTIPALIVATHGGGTGLPTQRECLESLGCYGTGKVHKLAEIVAGVVLAGEISLAAAISSLEWVSAHERLGRHR